MIHSDIVDVGFFLIESRILSLTFEYFAIILFKLFLRRYIYTVV